VTAPEDQSPPPPPPLPRAATPPPKKQTMSQTPMTHTEQINAAAQRAALTGLAETAARFQMTETSRQLAHERAMEVREYEGQLIEMTMVHEIRLRGQSRQLAYLLACLAAGLSLGTTALVTGQTTLAWAVMIGIGLTGPLTLYRLRAALRTAADPAADSHR
jgi:phosphate starvation-inducible protein PhoH